jgi:DNA polymerase elongation subunit (family B)
MFGCTQLAAHLQAPFAFVLLS